MCSHFLHCWKRVFAMNIAFSWQNPVNICPASFCTPRPNLTIGPGILTTHICIPVPYDGKTFVCVCVCVCVLVLESLVGLHRTVQLQLLWHYWSGHRLDYPDIEWFALETNRDHYVVFEIAPSTAFQTLFFFTMMATPFLLRDSCPQ